MPDIQLHLAVWRPSRLRKRLFYESQHRPEPEINELQNDRLHEQVYSWKLKGDVWTSLSGDEAGMRIKESIIASFDFSLRPEERGIKKLKPIVDKLRVYLEDKEHRQWQSWYQSITEEDPDNTYQIHPLICLHDHLSWLCDIFENTPGASVTIR
ncbi:MAG: hypothetical protein HY788_20635 [Deltaproteobacteria bacterium]|nr:hypothetical protein [Deltaproteobacteria bacterium]